LVVARKAHLRTILASIAAPVLIICLWRINSPFAPMSKRFSPPHRRRWSSAWVNSHIPSWKETLAIVSATLRPIDLHAVFISRRLEKLMPRPCSGKPQRASVSNRRTSIFGVGPYRGIWGNSYRLAKLSRGRWRSGQRGLRRVASRHAASPQPGADDSPHLPEAEASSASLRRPRSGERD
jgi:hypothetical protein